MWASKNWPLFRVTGLICHKVDLNHLNEDLYIAYKKRINLRTFGRTIPNDVMLIYTLLLYDVIQDTPANSFFLSLFLKALIKKASIETEC